jgi:general secretion pathway protein L
VLRKVVRLPLATEENLRQVLEFQIEQHTPFNSSQVYFGISVVERDFERGTLSADLIVTPRAVVDQAIKTMADRGGVVSAVFSADMLANGHLVNLLPAAVGRAPSPWFQGANLWLLALVGVMGLAAMILPLAVKREAVIQLHPWVDKGKNAAEAVDSVRRELEMRIDQHNFLLEKRQMFPTVIQTLEELTRVLPDDTWVLTLDIKGKELQIQGETASSVKLIGLFEQSSMFKDASFRSPLTKGQSSGTERYQLALQVRPVSPTASVGEGVLPVSAPASAAVLLPNPVASSPATKASDGVSAAISGVKGP